MQNVLYAKFTQNRLLRALLLGTGERMLREHSVKDSYWADGGGAAGKGKNRLGVLLMQLRYQLRRGSESAEHALCITSETIKYPSENDGVAAAGEKNHVIKKNTDTESAVPVTISESKNE
jgi:hypothetical protein